MGVSNYPVVTAAPRSKAEARDTTDTDLQAAEAAKLSVADAIAVAEKHSEGGTVLAVRFTVQGFRPTYFLRTYQNGEVWEGAIDANSGALLDPRDTTPESDLEDEERAELVDLRAAPTILAEAVKAAEEHVNGRAISGGLGATKSSIVWEVIVAANGAPWTVVVDAQSGQVTSSTAKT